MSEASRNLWIDPILHTGRPKDAASRSASEQAVYDFLDSLQIRYERLDHEATPSIECCEEVEKLLGAHICKNLVLCNRQKTDFYLLVMPGRKPFRTKELSSQIGSARLSFASPVFMEQFLHTSPGSASILGLLFDREHHVRLLIDRDIVENPLFACHPCANTSSLRLRTVDVLERILPALDVRPSYVSLSWAEASKASSPLMG